MSKEPKGLICSLLFILFVGCCSSRIWI